MFEGMRKARVSVRACLTAVALGACAVGVAGCGEESSSSESGAANGRPAAASDTVAKARELTELAGTSLVYGPGTGPVDVNSLRAPEADDIKPISYEPGKDKKRVAIVSCSPISGTCAHMSRTAEKFLAKLQIETRVYESDYTPAGNQRAVDNAIGIKPDAIYLVSIQPVTISQQIARAKAAGIKVVAGVGTNKINKGDLDAYVAPGYNMFQALSALQLIAASDGKAKVKWLSAPEFPELEEQAGIDVFKQNCSDCELSEGTETAAQVTSPVLMGQLMVSTLRKDPDLDYIQLASACADLGAANAAVRGAGDAVVSAPGCGATAIAAMNAGNLPFVAGTVESWAVLQGIDQILRLLAGEDPIPEEKTGPGAFLLTPENTPDKSTNATPGPLDRWAVEKFDFVAPYSEAWGVDLSPVIADAK